VTIAADSIAVNLKANGGISIEAVNGLYVNTGEGIANVGGDLEPRLEASNATLDKTLGGSNNELGVRFAAVSGLESVAAGLQINTDDVTIEKTAVTGDLKVVGGSIDTTQLAAGAVSLDKVSWRPNYEKFTGDGGTASWALAEVVDASHYKQVAAYRNGARIEYVAAAPTGTDQYMISEAGGVTYITIGSNLPSDETIQVDYVYDP
jgi:hypothetical protein